MVVMDESDVNPKMSASFLLNRRGREEEGRIEERRKQAGKTVVGSP